MSLVTQKKIGIFDMGFETYLESIAEAREEELKEIKARFLSRFDDQKEGLGLFRFLFRFVVCNMPVDFLWQLVEDDSYLDKTALKFDPIGWSNSDPGEIFEEWLVWYSEELTKSVKKKGHSLVFFGYNSNGKTFTALTLMSDALSKGMTSYYLTSSDLYRLHNKASYESSDLLGFYESIRSCEFLVIDELGKEVGDEAKIRRMLEDLIKTRSSYRLPTVLITNLMVSKRDVKTKSTQFIHRFGDSLWQQLLSRYHFFQFSKDNQLRAETRLEWGD